VNPLQSRTRNTLAALGALALLTVAALGIASAQDNSTATDGPAVDAGSGAAGAAGHVCPDKAAKAASPVAGEEADAANASAA
jgi:hypothetical protein